MKKYLLSLPDDFDRYEWEVTAKGFFSEATLFFGTNQYDLVFYDPVRLRQEIESELARGVVFSEPNLLVVQSVTGAAMRDAVEYLVKADVVSNFVARDRGAR